MIARLLWGSLKTRRARVALGALAVSLGAGMATALASLALKVGDDVAVALRAAGPNFLIQTQGASWTPDLGGAEVAPGRAAGSGLPDGSVGRLKSGFLKNNILEAAPELLVGVDMGGRRALLVGTWFTRSVPTEEGSWSTGLGRLRPGWDVEGRWPLEDGDEIAVGRELASRLGLHTGDRVEIRGPAATLRVTVSGLVSAGGDEDRQAWAPLALAQRLAARPGSIDRIWISALLKPGPKQPPPDADRDPKGFERYVCTAYPEVVAADVASTLPGVEVLPATERIAGEAHVVTRLTLLMVLLAGAALTASTLGLLSTTTATVLERAPELALLRSLGASAPQLAWMLLAETAIVALAGGCAGWWLGSAGAELIRGGSLGRSAAPSPLLLPLALAIASLVGLLGTMAPLRLALRLDPARVLRG